MRPQSGHIHFPALHRQTESTKCGKCGAFGLAVENIRKKSNLKRTRKMEAAAKQTFTFSGASPSDGEHEVRQMRSIWSGGGKYPESPLRLSLRGLFG
ncbi:MAG: hypothetical protein Q4A29_05550 [Eubacteriales bacterium]|nr:hypothetical protein [Eubacteriales bacterium]